MSHERRVFIDRELTPGATLELPLEAAHHLATVLRLKEGHPLIAVSKNGAVEFDAIVAALKPAVSIKVLGKRQRHTGRSRVGTVCIALLKGDRNELLCDYLTELGVSRIIFFQAGHSIAKLTPESAPKKSARWSKIAEAAAAQSGRADIPEIRFAPGLELALNAITPQAEDAVLCCSLAADAKELKGIELGSGPIHLIIGPEGDFTPQEEALLAKSKIQLLSLGPIRLRAEAAALSAVCTVNGVAGFV